MSNLEALEGHVHAHGACSTLQTVPDWFFPDYDGNYLDPINKGLLVCAVCPVRDECLRVADLAGVREGLWGGVPMSTHVKPADAIGQIAAGRDVRGRFLRRAVRALADERFGRDHGREPTRRDADMVEVRAHVADIREALDRSELPDDVLLEVLRNDDELAAILDGGADPGLDRVVAALAGAA